MLRDNSATARDDRATARTYKELMGPWFHGPMGPYAPAADLIDWWPEAQNPGNAELVVPELRKFRDSTMSPLTARGTVELQPGTLLRGPAPEVPGLNHVGSDGPRHRSTSTRNSQLGVGVGVNDMGRVLREMSAWKQGDWSLNPELR